MKKFKFPLQKLLDIRQAREDEIRNELMKILSVQNREKVIQDELLNKINLYEKLMFQAAAARLFDRETVHLTTLAGPEADAALDAAEALVFPAANHLRLGTDWSGFANRLAQIGPRAETIDQARARASAVEKMRARFSLMVSRIDLNACPVGSRYPISTDAPFALLLR